MFTTPRLLRKRALIALGALTASGLASAQETASQRAPANQKQAAASPNVEQKLLCKSASFEERHYRVNVRAKRCAQIRLLPGGAKAPMVLDFLSRLSRHPPRPEYAAEQFL